MPACASKMDIVLSSFFKAKGPGANVSQKKYYIIKWGPLFVIVSVLFCFEISCIPGWSQTCQVVDDDLELLILLSPPPKYYDYRQEYHHTWFYVVLTIKSRAPCMLDKDSSNWTTSPAPSLPFVEPLLLFLLKTPGSTHKHSWVPLHIPHPHFSSAHFSRQPFHSLWLNSKLHFPHKAFLNTLTSPLDFS